MTKKAKKLWRKKQSKKVMSQLLKHIEIFDLCGKQIIIFMRFFLRSNRVEWKHRLDQLGKNGSWITRDVAGKKWVKQIEFRFSKDYGIFYEFIYFSFMQFSSRYQWICCIEFDNRSWRWCSFMDTRIISRGYKCNAS